MEWEKAKDTSSGSTSNPSNELWEKLRQLNVPPKHNHLVWRALKEAIPTKKNLFQKSVKCDPLCPRCYNKSETTQHIFLECDWAKQVWLSSPLTINLSSNNINNLFDWILHMFNYTDKESMELIIATIYGIWYARNLLIFQEKILPPQEISHTALSQIHEYQRLCLAAKPLNRSNSTGTRSNNISWSPPPWGALKANVDAHLSSDGCWFAGIILRRADGSVVGAATRWHQTTNEVVLGEALALNDALDLLESLRISWVIL
jgi:hypothetical protein